MNPPYDCYQWPHGLSAVTAKGHLKTSKLRCVPDSMIETLQVIRDAAVHGAAVLGVPVKATIKEVHLQTQVLWDGIID